MGSSHEIYQMKEHHDYTINDVHDIADRIEEIIGADECWKTLRPAFSIDELLENLEFIARENDL